jgi:hypothetical protein
MKRNIIEPDLPGIGRLNIAPGFAQMTFDRGELVAGATLRSA